MLLAKVGRHHRLLLLLTPGSHFLGNAIGLAGTDRDAHALGIAGREGVGSFGSDLGDAVLGPISEGVVLQAIDLHKRIEILLASPAPIALGL